jgi:hypothetical protein
MSLEYKFMIRSYQIRQFAGGSAAVKRPSLLLVWRRIQKRTSPPDTLSERTRAEPEKKPLW